MKQCSLGTTESSNYKEELLTECKCSEETLESEGCRCDAILNIVPSYWCDARANLNDEQLLQAFHKENMNQRQLIFAYCSHNVKMGTIFKGMAGFEISPVCQRLIKVIGG